MRRPLQTTSYQSTPKPLGLQSLLLHDILSHNWSEQFGPRHIHVGRLRECVNSISAQFRYTVTQSRLYGVGYYHTWIIPVVLVIRVRELDGLWTELSISIVLSCFTFSFLLFLTYSVFDSFRLFGKKFIIKRLYFGSRKEEPSSPFGFRLVLSQKGFTTFPRRSRFRSHIVLIVSPT